MNWNAMKEVLVCSLYIKGWCGISTQLLQDWCHLEDI